PTSTHTAAATNTAVPTETPTEIVAVVVVATDTPRVTPSETVEPTSTASETSTATQAVTDIFALQETSVAAEASSIASEPPEPNILEETFVEEDTSPIPIEAIVGITLLLVVLGYMWFYWQGLAAAGRYEEGFVIDECPVCHRGHLHVDERQSRTFGIPTVRRTIRCDACRSVLRETAAQRWRYAVDRLENTTMYDRFNGREVTD